MRSLLRPSSFVLVLGASLTACPGPSQPDGGDARADATATDTQPDVQVDAPLDVQTDAPDAAADAGPSGIGNSCIGTLTGGVPDQGDCADGQICLPQEFGFSGGYCARTCTAGGSSACPAGSSCVVLGGSFSLCMLDCTTSADCRTDDGYACVAGRGGTHTCQPTDGPVGTRAGGTACFTTAAGPHQLAALPRNTFSAANIATSASRVDSVLAAEGNVVVNPSSSTPAVLQSYIAQTSGMVYMGTSTVFDGLTASASGTVRDPMQPLNSDPVLAYLGSGAARMVFLGYNYNPSTGGTMNMRVRVADSTDDGRNWSNVRAIEPPTLCANGCDKPWIAVGPTPNAGDGGVSGESLYVGLMVQRPPSSVQLQMLRSDDGGATWTTPALVASNDVASGAVLTPNLQTFVVDPTGRVHITYVGLNAASTSRSVRYGSPQNRVYYRSSSDGGRTWTGQRVLSRAGMDSPVYQQPVIDVDGSNIYVAFTSGTPSGAWDIVLATSNDYGATWRYRKANDDPETCATHAFPWLVADRRNHLAHVFWLENRFGDGAAVYARCPADGATPCAANETVSDATFTFATARDPARWHGDYLGITQSPTGDLWAGWSDTRSGRPEMYLARGVVR